MTAAGAGHRPPRTSLPQASSREGGTAEGGSPTEEPAPAFPVSQEERGELREVFEWFDPDGSGLIDVSDLKARSCKNAACRWVKTKGVRFSDASLVLISPHEVPHSCIASFTSFWAMEKKTWSGMRTSGHSELVGGGKKFHHSSRGLLLSYPRCQSLLSGFHQCSRITLTCAARDFV